MRVITAPSVEPISLAEVHTHLGIPLTDTVSDSIIKRRITEARMYAEQYTQRAIITQTQEIRMHEFPHGHHQCIELPFPNLLSIVSVKYIDTDGVLQTMLNTEYEIDTYSFNGSVRPTYGNIWPTARDEKNAVRIQYTCGYGPTSNDVPEILREAILLWVGHLMNFQPTVESGIGLSLPPMFIRTMLDQFAVIKIV